MKVLWFSSFPGLFDIPGCDKGYGGGAWIASLHALLKGDPSCQLAIAFPFHKPMEKFSQEDTDYYPIYSPRPSSFDKLKEYYGGYKKWDRDKYVAEARAVVADFRPDVAHIFGIENPFNNVLGRLDVPVVVHLQGFLAPYDNAFFPQGLNKSSFVFPVTSREWVLRNGYIFAKNSIHERGLQEMERFKSVRYTMGRTRWDYQISRLLAPQSTYRVVNEVLREPFYRDAGAWKPHTGGKLVVISTVSQTIYKGIDLVLKTADLLHRTTDVDLEWKVVGVKADSKYVTFFERAVGIKSAECGVRYLGVLDAEKLAAELLQASVYVHPSYIDNSPNSLCEAQMIGLPVIGTFVGGIPSLIDDGNSGLLIPANAPFELAYWLKRLSTDGELCARLSEGGAQAAAKRHDKRQIVADLLETYKEVIEVEKKRN